MEAVQNLYAEHKAQYGYDNVPLEWWYWWDWRKKFYNWQIEESRLAGQTCKPDTPFQTNRYYCDEKSYEYNSNPSIQSSTAIV
jgi:hypothetical protein